MAIRWLKKRSFALAHGSISKVFRRNWLAIQVSSFGAVAVLGVGILSYSAGPATTEPGQETRQSLLSDARSLTRSPLRQRTLLPPHWLQIRKLAGPYAKTVLAAARKVHLSARLLAAVLQVENGGDFQGSATRVSSAGAIGVMQLEPRTAWDVLRVNPWQATQNITGGARYLKMLLQRFHGKIRLALEAYNAGPTFIANGGRLEQANDYAREVLRDAFA